MEVQNVLQKTRGEEGRAENHCPRQDTGSCGGDSECQKNVLCNNDVWKAMLFQGGDW